MCELSFDSYATVWEERLVAKARKEHRCDTCCATIAVGESYMRHFSVFDGDANYEEQCLRCRTIGDAFQREHRNSVSPGSLYEYLDECIDEERWNVEEDPDEGEDRRPSRLSDAGLRWKHAIAEIWARRTAARSAA